MVFTSMTIEFVINFWRVFDSILIIHSCRHVYFKFLSNLANTLYDMTRVKVFKRFSRTGNFFNAYVMFDIQEVLTLCPSEGR